ncbi:thiol-disulfide isomerase/thioredoxin [Janthinobacterium sp. CG_23.3]
MAVKSSVSAPATSPSAALRPNRSAAIIRPTRLVAPLRAIADLRSRYPILGRAAAVRQQNGLLLLQTIAELHGGTCLAPSFTHIVGQRYRLRCARGHEWETELRILFKGFWCATCTRLSRRLTIEDMQRLAGKRDGQCLSSEYANSHTKLLWQCAAGHQWPATPANIGRGKWCPKCRGYMPADEQHAMLARLAQERGGQLLSTVYVGSHDLLEWQCANGHIWMASPGSVKNGPSWCPRCRGRLPKQEMLAQCRQIALERGGQLLSTHYLDNRNKLAWRCARGHTFEAPPGNIKSGQWCPKCYGRGSKEEHHAILSQLAVERGGRLVSACYLGARDKLTWECRRGHQWDATLASVKTHGRWCPQCGIIDKHTPTLMRKYHAVARERGGLCLSDDYTTAHRKMQWQCGEGHLWSASPSNIMGGKWCPRCSGRMPAAERHAQLSELAKERGGHLLSGHVVTLAQKLSWLCHRGHEWQAVASSVKGGTWCRQCANLDKCGPRAARKYLAPSERRDDFVPPAGQPGAGKTKPRNIP